MKKINLSIPQPCHEDWNKMMPQEKGRFCNSCNKTVIDFTNMSDRQLAEFFKKPVNSACGRFQPGQLNRDILIPKKRIPWVRYFFQFTLPAFLISMKAGAQKNRPIVGDTTICTNVSSEEKTVGKIGFMPVEKKPADRIKEIQGKVIDDKGLAVPFATVLIKGSPNGTICDKNGIFKMSVKDQRNIILVANAVGFTGSEIHVSESKDVTIVLGGTVMGLGEVLVAGYVRRKVVKPIPLIKKIFDTAFIKFSVYPNPVQNGSSFKIHLKRIEKGAYIISVIGNNGQIVQATEANIENKNQVLDFNLKEVAAGTYFVRLTNKKTGKDFTEKIIVQ